MALSRPRTKSGVLRSSTSLLTRKSVGEASDPVIAERARTRLENATMMPVVMIIEAEGGVEAMDYC
jgi:hypothetical protein